MNKQDKAEIKDIVTNAVRGIDGRLANLEQNVATKADIARIENRVDQIEVNMATKSDVRKLRKEIIEGNSRTARVATSSPTLEQFNKLKARVDFRFPVN